MKLKFTITVLLLTALSFGQTTWNVEFNDTSINGRFSEIKVTPSNNLFAVGSNSGNGLIYFYDGTDWTEIADSDPGNSSSIKSIAPISDTEYYTVSSKRDVHYYDGTNWTDISADLPDYIWNEQWDDRNLKKVISFSPDNVYVVGRIFESIQGWQLYVAHFDGSSWSQIDVPQSDFIDDGFTEDFLEIDAIDANDIWVATKGYSGFGDNELGVWHFDGTDWSYEGENLTNFGKVILRDVDAFAPDDVWFTGSRYNSSTNVRDAAYIHYDGTDYTLYIQPGTSTRAGKRYCIAKLDDNNIWSGNRVWDPSQDFTFFDGSSWSYQTTVLTSLSGSIRDIKKLNDCLYAVGVSDTLDHPLVVKTCSTPLSVDDVTNTLNQFSFYPNPTTNEIRLVNYENLDKLYIYDLTGKQVFYSSSIKQKIEVQNLKSGVYFLKVIDKKGNQQTKKMLKE